MERMQTKKCTRCATGKDVGDFTKDSRSKDGLQSWCKVCRKNFDAGKDRTEKNRIAREKYHQAGPESPEKRRQRRSARLFRSYGITAEEWDQLLDLQGDRCALCRGTSPGRWHTDHCHKDGHVRGIVCRPCNFAVGWYESGWHLPGFSGLVDSYIKGVHR